MNKFFKAINSIRRTIKCYSTIFVLIWLILSTYCGYAIFYLDQKEDMPNEEKYLTYETIIQQIVDGNIQDVDLPDNTDISISKNTITISNAHSYYMVKGNFTETEIAFERKDSEISRILNRFVVGGLLFGFVIIGYVGLIGLLTICRIFRILYNIFCKIIYGK